MASIVTRDDSPFFFLSFKDPQTWGWKKRRLPIRKEDPDAQRKCAMAVAQAELEEAAMLPAGPDKVRGWGWVPRFIESHYTNAKSKQRALNAWAPVLAFLEWRKIAEAAMVTYAHGHEYVAWRQSPPKECRLKPRAKNTALTELKLFGVALQHGVKLGLLLANPIYRLGIRRDAPKEKAAITPEERQRIEAALANEKPWMADAWAVAWRQGCRLGQVGTPLKDIDLAAGTIKLPRQKGKAHVQPLHPDLVPLVRRRLAEGAERLVDLPRVPSVAFWKFFRRIELPHLCFHSTRVSVVTRLAEAGVNEQQAMAYVGHASTTIHGVYQKVKAQRVAHLAGVLG